MINLTQTIADETTDALNALVQESDRFRDWDTIEVRAFVRELETLKKVDARRAFVLFGSFAAICGKVDEVSEYFSKALRLTNDLHTRGEFWKSFVNVGLYGKAHEIGIWLLDPNRGFFPSFWQMAVSAGQLRATWNRLSDAKKTYPEELSQADFSMLESAIAVLDAHGLSDHDVASVFDLMGEIQRTHRIMFAGQFASKLRVMRPPDDEPYLYFTIPLNASISEIHTMNRELAKLIVERLPAGSALANEAVIPSGNAPAGRRSTISLANSRFMV
jgi:hypothetical protein